MRELVRAVRLADEHRNNGRFAQPRIEAGVIQAGFPVLAIGPQVGDALGLLFQNVEGRQTGRRHGRRMRSGKQKRPRAVIQKVNQIARAAHVAAQHAHRF